MQRSEQRKDMYHDFYTEVVRRTVQLVVAWQCVGFCHGKPGMHLRSFQKRRSKVSQGKQSNVNSVFAGVLNTDNMSILGLTIDYGPYGFLDR